MSWEEHLRRNAEQTGLTQHPPLFMRCHSLADILKSLINTYYFNCKILLIYIYIEPNTFCEKANDQLFSSTIIQQDTFVFMKADYLGSPYFYTIVNQHTMCLS